MSSRTSAPALAVALGLMGMIGSSTPAFAQATRG
jgi:hypothetical protein